MIEYRPLKNTDLPAVQRIEKESFPDPWTEYMFAGAFLSEFFYGVGAFDEGTLVGFILSTIVFEDVETDDLAVLPAYRKQGIGKTLLSEVEKKALQQGAERSFLEVRVSNIPALALYKSSGYQVIRRREKYYPDGEDAFVMMKNLAEKKD